MAITKRGSSYAVTVYDPATKRKRHVGTRPTKEQAEDLEYRERKRARKLSARPDAAEFARNWVDRYPRRRESTNIGYRERISKFERDFAGRTLDSITKVEARAWARANRSRFQAVRAMFSDAVRDGLVDVNPFLNLRLPQSEGRRHLVVPTEEELDALALAAARIQGEWGRVVLSPFIVFAAHTGLRPGELYALEWDAIDLAGRTVRVDWAWSQTERKKTMPKYESRRTIYLPPPAAEALEAVARIRGEVFSGPRGGMLTGTVMSHYWRPVVNAVGRPEFTPHCLRHYYGTMLARKGLAPYEIAAMMGHHDGGKLAMDRYIHLSERDAREKVAAAFGTNVRDLKAVDDAG